MARRLTSNDQVLAGMLQDPAFRAEWERTVLARAVAEAVIRYRAKMVALAAPDLIVMRADSTGSAG